MTAQFDDGKESGAFRTIGELSHALGLKPHVLRYWEQHFPMLQPLKRSGGRRYYRPEDVALVERIDQLVNREGYTLKGAMKALSGGSAWAGQGGETSQQSPEQLPLDGGVDTFFGREPAAASPAAALPDHSEIPPELVNRLRAIRDRLASAVGN